MTMRTMIIIGIKMPNTMPAAEAAFFASSEIAVGSSVNVIKFKNNAKNK